VSGGGPQSDEVELRRLRWRCRRGMRELDQLLERWLERGWAQSSEDERGVFLRLLDCEDDRLWRWFMGFEHADDAALDSLVQRIRNLPASD
jgi:antitoxin CptB